MSHFVGFTLPDGLGERLRHFDELDDAAGYDVDLLIAHVEHDRGLLRDFAAKAATVSRPTIRTCRPWWTPARDRGAGRS